MTPPSVDSYGTPTLSIEEVFPAKNFDNDEAHFQVQNNNKDGEHFQADSSIKKTWSAFEHFPAKSRINQLIPSAENELIPSADSEEATTMSAVTSNSTSVSTSIYVVLNTRYRDLELIWNWRWGEGTLVIFTRKTPLE